MKVSQNQLKVIIMKKEMIKALNWVDQINWDPVIYNNKLLKKDN